MRTPASAALGIEHAIRTLEGRWKLVILFHLFGGKTLRFSDLERVIPGISQPHHPVEIAKDFADYSGQTQLGPSWCADQCAQSRRAASRRSPSLPTI